MAIAVKNINGTSDTKCKCGSWIDHWQKYSTTKVGLCREVNCRSIATDGAHVQKADSSDNNWYIIPLCQQHNLLKWQELRVIDSTTFVPANKRETCEK